MAVREFDGIDDEIIAAIGTLTALTHGTVAVLVERLSTGAAHSLIGFSDSTGEQGDRTLVGWSQFDGLLWVTTAAASTGAAHGSSGVWRLIVGRKATGSAQPRFSVYDYAAGTWAHENGNASIADGLAPGAGGFVRFRGRFDPLPHARFAARAAWSNTLPWSADATGDAAIEAAGLETSLQAWLDAGADACWAYNQADVATAVTDLTGNGADQTSLTGTTVVTGDDPPGFDFALSGGGGGTIAAAPVGLTLTAEPATTVTGPVAVTAQPVDLTLTPRPAGIAGGGATVTAAPVDLTLTAQPPTATATTTITAQPVALALTAQPGAVTAGGVAAARPAPLTLTAQPATPVPGTVTVAAAPIDLALTARPAATTAASSIAARPAALALTPRAATLLPGGVAVEAEPIPIALIPRPGTTAAAGEHLIGAEPVTLTLAPRPAALIARVWTWPIRPGVVTAHRAAGTVTVDRARGTVAVD